MLLAIDPGANEFGAALYRIGGIHVATLIRNAVGAEESHLARAAGALEGVAAWLKTVGVRPTSVLVEMPFVYPGKKTKNPNSVMITAAMCGAFAVFGTDGNVARSVFPAEWKGQMKGDPFIESVIKPSVTPAELARIDLSCAPSYRHNVWDAVGLALWSAGRLKARRVYPGATEG